MSNKNSLEWDYGYHHGYEEGKTKGYAEGYYEGYEKGIQERAISTKGYDDGFTAGFQSGKVVGYNEGKKTTPTETQISDNTFKSVFPKHLKTDKEFLKKLQKSKEDCITHIEFDKIHSVMQYLDWKWFTGDDCTVPSMSKLVMFAQKQLNIAVQGFLENDCDDYMCHSGGFKASVQGFADGFCRVTLEFVVTDWDSEIEGNIKEE